jgi:hypothetical protein
VKGRCWFNTLALSSAISLVALVVAWITAVNVDLAQHPWSVTPRLHVAVAPVARGNLDVDVVLVNDSSFQPLWRGIKAVSGSNPAMRPAITTVDVPGFYYCRIRGPLGDSVWTLRLSLLCPLLLTAVFPWTWWNRRRNAQKRGFPVAVTSPPPAART